VLLLLCDDKKQEILLSNRRLLPLSVRVGDRDRQPIRNLTAQHQIQLSPETSHVTFGVHFDPELVSLEPDHPAHQSFLRLSGFPLTDEIRVLARDRDAETDLLPGELAVMVVANPFAILVLAGIGGILGGLARQVYEVRPSRIWPARIGTRLEPGLIGNVVFSVLFGVVMFLGVKLGVLDPGGFTGAAASRAFLLGVLGGFGGILVLQRMTQRALSLATGDTPATGSAAA
jgi:hypothetical protein